MLQNRRIISLLLWLMALAALLPVLTHLVASIHSRPMVDDFCLTNDTLRLGVWGHVLYLYENWTGTYTSTFFQSLIGLYRLWSLTPGVLIVLWLGAFTVLFQELIGIRRPEQLTAGQRFLLSVSLSAVTVAVIVNGTHNVYQSVYWTSGAITYTLPLIINTFSLAIFIRVLKLPSGSRAQLPVLGLLAGLCVLAAGCSPLFAVVQVAAWFFLMVGCWLFIAKQLRRAGLTSAATAFIFAGIGFLLVALAPGNALRRDNFGENLSLLDTIIFSARMTVAFILADPFILIPLMVAALLGGRYYQTQDVKSSSKRLLQLVSLTVEVLFVLVFLGFFTGVFATNQSPPLRSRIVMHYTVVISVAVIGFVSGYSFAQWLSHFELPRTSQFQLIIRFAAGAVILIVGSSLLQMTLHTLNENVKLSTYAAEWDAMEAQLQVADADDEIVLQPFTYDLHVMAVLRPISASTDNRCMRNYYGVKSIQMLPKASGSAAG